MKLFVTMIIFSALACKTIQQVNQGLEGYVFLKKGNQMPAPGHQISRGKGISTKIYIYLPVNQQQVTGAIPVFTRIKTKLVATVQSDSTGHYMIKLPAGEYSVFIDNNGSLFASETNDKGILNPVIINNAEITSKNFTISKNAAY